MALPGRLAALLVGLVAIVPAHAAAQGSAPRPRWTVGVGLGPARIDDLAGSPAVPSASLERTIGTRGLFGLRAGWIHDAGFYSLDAVTLELGLGLRATSGHLEVSALAGPSAILGGDSDGTPYAALGPHLTVTGTAWLGRRLGLHAAAIGRMWTGSDGPAFKPAVAAGVTLTL